MSPTRLGTERLLEEEFQLVAGQSLGLITNHSGVDAHLGATADQLLAAGARLQALFGPEHGIRGDAADGVQVDEGRDARAGLEALALVKKLWPVEFAWRLPQGGHPQLRPPGRH